MDEAIVLTFTLTFTLCHSHLCQFSGQKLRHTLGKQRNQQLELGIVLVTFLLLGTITNHCADFFHIILSHYFQKIKTSHLNKVDFDFV